MAGANIAKWVLAGKCIYSARRNQASPSPCLYISVTCLSNAPFVHVNIDLVLFPGVGTAVLSKSAHSNKATRLTCFALIHWRVSPASSTSAVHHGPSEGTTSWALELVCRVCHSRQHGVLKLGGVCFPYHSIPDLFSPRLSGLLSIPDDSNSLTEAGKTVAPETSRESHEIGVLRLRWLHRLQCRSKPAIGRAILISVTPD